MNKKFLIIDSRPYGLFSIFLHTIDNIKWAKDNGYIPVVRWGPGRRDSNHGRVGINEYRSTGNVEALDKNNFLTEASPRSFGNTPGLKHCQCLYWSESGHYGEKNPWRYYFEPLNEYTVLDAENSTHDVSDIFMVGELDDSLENKFLIKSIDTYEPLVLWDILGSSHESTHRKAVNKIITEHVRIREEIMLKTEIFYKKHFDFELNTFN